RTQRDHQRVMWPVGCAVAYPAPIDSHTETQRHRGTEAQRHEELRVDPPRAPCLREKKTAGVPTPMFTLSRLASSVDPVPVRSSSDFHVDPAVNVAPATNNPMHPSPRAAGS